jgi:hypothetical protein
LACWAHQKKKGQSDNLKNETVFHHSRGVIRMPVFSGTLSLLRRV